MTFPKSRVESFARTAIAMGGRPRLVPAGPPHCTAEHYSPLGRLVTEQDARGRLSAPLPHAGFHEPWHARGRAHVHPWPRASQGRHQKRRLRVEVRIRVRVRVRIRVRVRVRVRDGVRVRVRVRVKVRVRVRVRLALGSV